MNYNLIKKEINNLNDIDETNKHYYNYKNIDFYYKKYNTTDKLVVSFHGSRPSLLTPLPIFRGYNYNYNILCISDKLLEDCSNNEIATCWYLSPKTTKYQETYIDIISFFLQKYTDVLFIGSSAGGLPSLLYASYFQKKACILNSQLYIKNYYGGKTLNKLFNKLSLNDSDFEEYDLEKILLKYGSPLHTYIYINKNDTHHYNDHFIPFQKFIENNNLMKNFTFNSFIGKEPLSPLTHHHMNTPINFTIDKIISNIFN